MILPKLEAEILRLYHAEKWRVGTIAGQLGIHHSVVRRALARDGAEEPKRCRATRLDPYIPLIIATWKQYPKLQMIGGIDKRAVIKGKEAIDEELDSRIPYMLKKGGYIPYVDHHVPPDVSLNNYVYYRQKLKSMIEKHYAI